MQITKVIFDSIPPGRIFRVVTTNIQNVVEPFSMEVTFVSVKGKSGVDWAIYSAPSGNHTSGIAQYGDKVMSETSIRNICPCDDEVFQLYRL